MLDITTVTDVMALITGGVNESTTLEYKSTLDTTNDSWKKGMALNMQHIL